MEGSVGVGAGAGDDDADMALNAAITELTSRLLERALSLTTKANGTYTIHCASICTQCMSQAYIANAATNASIIHKAASPRLNGNRQHASNEARATTGAMTFRVGTTQKTAIMIARTMVPGKAFPARSLKIASRWS